MQSRMVRPFKSYMKERRQTRPSQIKSGFDRKFEDLFKDRSEEELRAIREKYQRFGRLI